MTNDLTARVAYGLAKARHRSAARRRHGRPIVVFSMAKTGSSALVGGLRGAGFDDVHQVHDLDPAFLAQEESEYHWAGRPWRNWDAQVLLGRPPTRVAPWCVVSIVRDPIAQTISAFFQPGVRRGYLTADATVESLRARFGDRLDHLPVRWFESHVQPALGIDVYASDFDPELGYQIVTTPEVRLLLLRCEGLEVAPRALAELLGDERPVEIQRLNVATDKDYADLYQSFLATVHPTPEQIEAAYTSRLVQHFYAPAEIAGFRRRWSAGARDEAAR